MISEKTKQEFYKVLGKANVENIEKDFIRFANPTPTEQVLNDTLFHFFCMGVVNTLNPKSIFNTEYFLGEK